MVARSTFGLVLLAAVSGTAWQLPQLAPPSRAAGALRSRELVAQERLTPAQEAERKARARAALEAADDKLESLNQVEKMAPTSWADLGIPLEKDDAPVVPAFVSQAPLFVGGFSVMLFLLNSFGLFGEGPDLDALAEEWSKM